MIPRSTARNAARNPARIRTLDGWRGIAILLVILDHATANSRFDQMLWAKLGSFGVDIFFVLSGYIITLRFLEEQDRSSRIHLGRFYLRRAFRILPIVVVYLLAVSVLSHVVDLVDFHASEVAGSLFFFRNYQHAAHPGGLYTLHFWSLSIEEHFYLLWPAIFLWIGTRRALWFAISGAVVCAAWRAYDIAHPASWLGSLLPGQNSLLRASRTDARLDGLLLGCALAILLARPAGRAFIHRNFPKETPLFAGILLVMNLVRTGAAPTLSSYLLITLLLAATLVVEEGIAHGWLNTAPLVWVGTISYSIYVWQEIFLLRPAASVYPLGVLSRVPMNIVAVFAVSALSFYFLEKPCIALGRRFIAGGEARRLGDSAERARSETSGMRWVSWEGRFRASGTSLERRRSTINPLPDSIF